MPVRPVACYFINVWGICRDWAAAPIPARVAPPRQQTWSVENVARRPCSLSWLA